jgi:hypothetical protein
LGSPDPFTKDFSFSLHEIPQTIHQPYTLFGYPSNQFSDGLAPIYIENENKNSFMDKKGKVKKWRFHLVLDFSEGLAPVSKVFDGGFKVGYIDTKGNLVIDYKFDVAMPFREGLAAVLIGPQTFTVWLADPVRTGVVGCERYRIIVRLAIELWYWDLARVSEGRWIRIIHTDRAERSLVGVCYSHAIIVPAGIYVTEIK